MKPYTQRRAHKFGSYSSRNMSQLARHLQSQYDWIVTYEESYEEETGYGTVQHYNVTVEGQYAEDEAEKAIEEFGVYSVYVEWTEHSAAGLHVSFD